MAFAFRISKYILANANIYLEVLRFLINDRICDFRNTHMFGCIILHFSGKYYFNRKSYVYIYLYNTKSLSTEHVLKSYLLHLFREKWYLHFSHFNFTYKHGIFDYMRPIAIFPLVKQLGGGLHTFHILNYSLVFSKRSSILL